MKAVPAARPSGAATVAVSTVRRILVFVRSGDRRTNDKGRNAGSARLKLRWNWLNSVLGWVRLLPFGAVGSPCQRRGRLFWFSRKGEGIQLRRLDMSSMPGKWLSVKEVAGQLDWSTDTVRRLIYRGELKAVILPQQCVRGKRIYRPTRIAESEVQRFINDNGGGA